MSVSSTHVSAGHDEENQLPREDFRLGPWHVSPQRQCISPAGPRPVDSGEDTLRRSLEPRLMRLLCILASRPGEVFTRDELVARIWPRVIVNENSLTRAVSDLRRHLRYPGDRQTTELIETIPKRGYRLTQDVRLCAQRDAAPVVPAEEAAVAVSRASPAFDGVLSRWRAMWSAAAASLFGASLVLGWLTATGTLGSPFFDGNREQGVTADRVMESSREQTIPPEASWLETAMQREEAPSPGNENQQIDNRVVMSPNREWFTYVRYSESGTTLMVGSTQLARPPMEVFHSESFIDDLQWSPVGNALLFTLRPDSQRTSLLSPEQRDTRLMLLDLETMTAYEVHRDGSGESGQDREKASNLT